MKRLVDVVNFNADASCLPSAKWLEALSGGTESVFSRWLSLYVDQGKKVVLGLTGASVADIATWNPEAIDLINRNSGIFEIILRPFAHDIALLRTGEGFSVNFDYGKRIIRKEFRNVAPHYLPPEFMLTGKQISRLSAAGCPAYSSIREVSHGDQERIPAHPYKVAGVFGSSLNCIPFHGVLTDRYLRFPPPVRSAPWNEAVSSRGRRPTVFLARRGEPVPVPRGQEREKAWLDREAPSVERVHIADLSHRYTQSQSLKTAISGPTRSTPSRHG